MGARTIVTLGLTALVAGAIAYAMRSGGRVSADPIRIEGQRLVVENETGQAWRGVTVTINAYYRATAPTIDSGGRLEAPLANLETGLGQRFDTRATRHASKCARPTRRAKQCRSTGPGKSGWRVGARDHATRASWEGRASEREVLPRRPREK